MTGSLSQRLIARYFAVLLAASGLFSAFAHVVPNPTGMSGIQRVLITGVCLVGAIAVWYAPWERWSRWALVVLPPIGLGIKTWANLLGGLGPLSYSIHFALVFVWMGVALPRWTPLAMSPLLAAAYIIPLWYRGDPKGAASVVMVVPICVLIGESVAWISNRLRDVELVDAQHMRRMEWLVQASLELAHQHTRSDVARVVARLASELPSAIGAAVFTLSRDRCLDRTASHDWGGELPMRFSLRETPALREAVRRREILGQDEPSCAALGARLGVPRLGVAPLLGSKGCTGAVLLVRRAGAAPFDSFTRDLVRTLSLQAGLALERVRRNEELLDASLQDPLTGLGNRRKASGRLEALQSGDALVAIDLDYFKRVNDRHGHAAGDQVLCALSAYLEEALRECDEAFRMGGEEFLVVLHQAGASARDVAQRLCDGWRRREPMTSFSGGVAIFEADEIPEDTLKRADLALYEAKRSGRDRVAVSE